MYKLNNWFIRFNNKGKINYYVEKTIDEDQNDNIFGYVYWNRIGRGHGLENGDGTGNGVGNGVGSENGHGSGDGSGNGAGLKNGYIAGDRYRLQDGYFGR